MEKRKQNAKKVTVIAAVILMFSLVIGMGAFTYAKYVSTQETGNQNATAAKWGIVISADASMFGTDYTKGDGANATVVAGGADDAVLAVQEGVGALDHVAAAVVLLGREVAQRLRLFGGQVADGDAAQQRNHRVAVAVEVDRRGRVGVGRERESRFSFRGFCALSSRRRVGSQVESRARMHASARTVSHSV